MEKNKNRFKNTLLFLLCLVFFVKASGAEELTKIKLLLNGKPATRLGGFYEARDKGFFKKAGVAVELIPNDANTNVLQLLVDGKADFAIASADDIVLMNARLLKQSKNLPAPLPLLTAIFAVFQNSPQGILVHKNRHFLSIQDVFAKEGDLALQMNLASTFFLKQSFASRKVTLLPYQGDLPSFLRNSALSLQGDATQDALALLREGAQLEAFLVSDLGYAPYENVVVGREDLLKKSPNVLKAMTQALREGWQSYLANPELSNTMMHKLNPFLSLETFAESSLAQKAFIENSDTQKNALGYMSNQRWENLIQKMLAAEMLKAAERVEAKRYFIWQL